MDANYKEPEKEELINEAFERLQSANEDNESLRSVITDIRSRNDDLTKAIKSAEDACEIHVSNNVKLRKDLDKANKDLRISNELIKSLNNKIDDNASEITLLKEDCEFYKDSCNESLRISKRLLIGLLIVIIYEIISIIIRIFVL